MYRILCSVTILSFCIVFKVNAQVTLKGKVVDKKTLEPIELAVITDVKTAKNTVTDKDGVFVLKNVITGDPISVSCIGYTANTMPANNTKIINIQLVRGSVSLKDVTITNRSFMGSVHSFSLIDLNMQPARSAQDLLRLVPGLFIAQHQGGGKAEQIFLRGFDADHGSDVNISVDGMPVNMVTHAHGQGYADLHFVIPETIAGYEFGKGPYYTDKGNLCTAGYVAYNTKNVLDNNMVKIEGGQFTTGRVVGMFNLLSNKAKEKGQSAYIAGEALYSNGGPFHLPEHFTRYNLFGKFNTKVGADSKLSVTLSTLSSGWRASGEIPNRAVAEGYISDRFGALDSAQGGYTSRTNAIVKLVSNVGNNFALENEAFYSHYYFNLISNFTFFYYYPTTGDEFRQHDVRDVFGYKTKISRQTVAGNTIFSSVAGVGFRYDNISPVELDHTEEGNFLGYLQFGNARELNLNAFVEENITTGNWLFNIGVRADYFHFYYMNMSEDTVATKIYSGLSPYSQKAIVSPKLNIQYTFNPKFQLYIKSGKGFHSNDARAVIAQQGFETLPACYGADLGFNWKPIPKLYINTALWYLFLQQEFTFGQDLIDQPDGAVGLGGKTRRIGIDLSARYQFAPWLFGSFNINFARPRYIDSAVGNNYLALAPTLTSTASLDVRFKNGINGGISYRYLHDRAANSNYSLTAVGYWVTDLTLNYTKKKYEVGLAIENLLNVQWNESQFEYVSRLKYEAQPVDDVSYTPGVPFFAKLHFSVLF